MNKLIFIIVIICLVGCRSKSKLVEKNLVGAKVERIAEVEKVVEEKKQKDSIIEKVNTGTKTNTDTNIHVEFDPKKNDSLEVIHSVGGDSVKLKIRGNGVVTFDYKKAASETISKVKEIFGSKTLYNIDSTVHEKQSEKSKITVESRSKAVKEKDAPFLAYVWLGAIAVFLILLVFLWKKFGGGIVDRFKNGKL